MKLILARTETAEQVENYRQNGWGRMYITRTPKPYPGEPWEWDNGAYQAWATGRKWDSKAYQNRTERTAAAGLQPYLAVIPDVVANPTETLKLAEKWLPKLPTHWPLYLALQDGITPEQVSQLVPSIAGLFLGGTNEFKRKNAATWADFARSQKLKFHYARASTHGKLRHAQDVRADSIDTACPLWVPRQFAQWKKWTTEIKNPTLFQ